MQGEECSEAELMLWFKITLCSFKCVTLPPGGSGWSTTAYLYTCYYFCSMYTVHSMYIV